MTSYPQIFALNFILEFVIILTFLELKFWRRIFIMELLLNLATHPALWWLLPKLPGSYIVNLIAAELVVVGAEISLGLFFFRVQYSRTRLSFAILAANLTTFLMTFVI